MAREICPMVRQKISTARENLRGKPTTNSNANFVQCLFLVYLTMLLDASEIHISKIEFNKSDL